MQIGRGFHDQVVDAGGLLDFASLDELELFLDLSALNLARRVGDGAAALYSVDEIRPLAFSISATSRSRFSDTRATSATLGAHARCLYSALHLLQRLQAAPVGFIFQALAVDLKLVGRAWIKARAANQTHLQKYASRRAACRRPVDPAARRASHLDLVGILTICSKVAPGRQSSTTFRSLALPFLANSDPRVTKAAPKRCRAAGRSNA